MSARIRFKSLNAQRKKAKRQFPARGEKKSQKKESNERGNELEARGRAQKSDFFFQLDFFSFSSLCGRLTQFELEWTGSSSLFLVRRTNLSNKEGGKPIRAEAV